MKHILTICLGTAAIILSVSVGYYLLVIQPHEEQAKLSYQKQKDAEQKQRDAEAAYQTCLKNPPASNTGNPFLDNYVRSCGSLKPR
jgi:hypothetical protein